MRFVPNPVESARYPLLARHRAGHAAADRWLDANHTRLGRHGTVDIVAQYLGDGLDETPTRNRKEPA
jgi:hypothetical protein